MTYTKIYPLGKREGRGSFDTYCERNGWEPNSARASDKLVVIDFVVDENNIIYFEAHHSDHPEDKEYLRLQVQHFPFGIDMVDDFAALNLAAKLFKKYSNNGK